MHNKLASKVGVVSVTWPKFTVLDPLHTFRMDKDTHSKFCGLIHCMKPIVEIWKFDPYRAWLGHVTIFEILGPPYIFGITKARNFIFGAHIDHDMLQPMRDKFAPKVGVVRVTWPIFKVWDPLHNLRMDKATHTRFCGLIHSVNPIVGIWKFDP